MKKIILLMLIALPLAQATQAQHSPFSGEWRYKSSGELINKVFCSGKIMRLETEPKPNKPAIVTLIFPDSTCILAPNTKTYMVMSNQARMKNEILGIEIDNISSTTTVKFIKSEEIEGFPCSHYELKNENLTSTEPGGVLQKGWDREVWITPQINHPIQEIDAENVKKILTKIVIAAQPANLFVIPNDYKRAAMGNQFNMDGWNDTVKQYQERTGGNDAKSEQTEQEKIQNALKILEGLNKK